MRRGMVLAQLAVFALVAILIVSYTVFGLLKVSLVHRPFHVTVQLHRAGGIFTGAEVAYRGVQVGKVSSLALHPDGVTITLAIDDGAKIPADATANVYDLSAVGEQYVDLRPREGTTTTTFLHAGSVIGVRNTTTPLDTATVLYDLEQFINSISPGDLTTLAREGALALTNTGPQLRSILANTTEIVDQLSTSEPAMLSLLHNADVLLQGAAAHTDDFDAFTRSLRALSRTLAASTPTITKLVDQAAPTTQLINSVITRTGSSFVPLLNGLATLSTIQVARVPALRTLLVAVPEFAGLAPGLIRGGALQGAGNINQSQPLCNTGVPLTSPISGTRTPLYDVQCGSGLVRGAANAPRASTGTSTSVASASALTTPDGTQVGGYDPDTGVVSTADGSLVRLGTDGGQQQVFGNNSWKAVLLAGVTS